MTGACKVCNLANFLERYWLIEISGTDYPERENRFEVAYELLSFYCNRRIRSFDFRSPWSTMQATKKI